ncbi:MAG: PAS domain S-box protein [Gammaproteobacteria bacterium]|nr:PAS domain S-box protein [Gammaproteobacteria bacterium]
MEQSVVRNSDLIDTLQRYADLFTFAPIGYVVLGQDSRVDDANRAAAEALGWPRSWIVGQLFSRWIVGSDLGRFLDFLHDACRSEKVVSGEFRIEDRHGRLRDVRFDAAAMMVRETHDEDAEDSDRPPAPARRCQLAIVDMKRGAPAASDTNALRDELAHVARLNACGEMATALAHELSQPLGAIALYCNASVRTIREGKADPERLAASLEKAADAAMHASCTIRGLRSFLSKSDSSVELLPLNDVIRDGAQMAAAYAKKRRTRIELRLDDTLPTVRANRTHLQQVLLNLLQNSIDAMQDLEPERRRVVITSDRFDTFTVRVTVADFGPGMTETQRRRAFEPFYTTKKNGMGVGLPISRMIIESYGGRLWAPRGVRRGATLSFTLPAHEHY